MTKFCSTCRNQEICNRHHDGDVPTGKNGCHYDPSMHYPIPAGQLVDKIATFGEWWFWTLELATAKIRVNKIQMVEGGEYIDGNDGTTIPLDDEQYVVIEPVQEPGYVGEGIKL